jgi:hypothetical protein
MKDFIKKLFKNNQTRTISRKDLEQKVQRGTEKAVKEYGYVFRKLAEYDRT